MVCSLTFGYVKQYHKERKKEKKISKRGKCKENLQQKIEIRIIKQFVHGAAKWSSGVWNEKRKGKED